MLRAGSGDVKKRCHQIANIPEMVRADVDWMDEALVEARRAGGEGEVPVGAVVVHRDEIIGRGRNRREAHRDPLAHAEILAIREAADRIEGWRLTDCALFVTLEPCAMCAGALVNSRMERLVFAARDPKAGYCGSLGNIVEDARLNHRVEVTAGVRADEAAALLRDFFASLRRNR
jgi:tRNA(adenine34) deaminase